MNKNKSYIDTYKTIYPIDIVVANRYATLKELQELYTYHNGEELDERMMSNSDIITTTKAKRKSDGKCISLIKYIQPNNIKSIDLRADFVNSCAHEAVHVALDTYEFIGEDVCLAHQEPFAYFVGYITECIYKTLKKK